MVLPSKPDPRRRPPRPSPRRQGPKKPGWFARLLQRWFGPRFKADPSRYRAYQSRQSVLRLDARLPPADDVGELREALVERGLEPRESDWTFYLAPGPELDRIVPDLADVYGPGVGLKVLKDMQPPEDAIYAAEALAIGPKGTAQPLAPSPAGLLRVAGLLHVAGLGPRVHDLIHLTAGGRDLSAYVVDHVGWKVTDATAYRTFMRRLKPVMKSGLLSTPTGKLDTDSDFPAPDCHDNLRLDPANGEPLYVDFHTFAIPDETRLVTTFARDALPYAGGDRHRLQQSIPGAMPGQRDTEARTAAIAALMRKPNLSFDNRLVFDVGCNSGLMMAEALAAGALWAYGWDHVQVAQGAQRILAALGASRSTLFGETIGPDSDLAGMLPPHHRLHGDGVLLYLDVDSQIGAPAGVGYLPWQLIVFEGEAGTDVGAAWRWLQQAGWFEDGSLLSHTLLADDDGLPRPLLLARRRRR